MDSNQFLLHMSSELLYNLLITELQHQLKSTEKCY